MHDYRHASDPSTGPDLDGLAVNPDGRQCGVIEVRDASPERGDAGAMHLLTAAVESANDAVIITEVCLDLPGPRIEYVNPAFARMTGWTADEVLGKSPRILQGPRTSRKLLDRLINDLKASESFHGEAINYRKDGSHYSVEWRITPLRNAEGRVFKWVAIQRDVTARVEAEREREEIFEAERAAREEAERAGRLKDEFLATLSHELRTPINAVLGWAQILRSAECNDEDFEQGLEAIERNSRSQAQLIEDLLDMSRIISDKIRLDVQPINLAAAVSSAVDSVVPAAEARGVRLQRVLDPLGNMLVRGDPGRLQQVVWNLLSNAVKFTPRGGRVSVVLQRNGSSVEIVVTDTGQGISPEFLPHLFERFRQADASTTRRQGGLGIGLSIVKSLVELHGGTVRAHSEGSDRGATFTVSLPVSAAVDDAPSRGTPAHPRSDPSPASSNTVDLTGVHILVVDDEPDARRLVKRLLETRGATVEIAGSVDAALGVLRGRDGIDVLVSDIGMPDRDGYDLIREVRADSALARTPAVALTAFARAQDRTRVMLAGYQVHVAKPVEPAELCAVVASLAGRTGVAEK